VVRSILFYVRGALKRGVRWRPDSLSWSFPPDRRLLVAGSDVTAELRLFDLRRLGSLGDVELAS
jgi:hypothetical protein